MRHIRAGREWSEALEWRTAGKAPALALAVSLTATAALLYPVHELAPDWGSVGDRDRMMADANPAAVLAWAKVNCDSGLELAAGAPRTQLEIILQVAAFYDADSRRRGFTAVCAEALSATQSAAAPSSTPVPAAHRTNYGTQVSSSTR